MVRIFTAKPSDLPLLHALRKERAVILSQTDPRFSSLINLNDLWGENRISEQTATVLIASKDDAIIGYITGYIHNTLSGTPGIIDEIALDAHTYHVGLGRKLFLSMQHWFTENNAQQIIIKTPRYYAVEQAFWRSLGAKEWKESSWETPPQYIWMIL